MLKPKIGVVLRKSTEKTLLVKVLKSFIHPKYKICYKTARNFLIHSNNQVCKNGSIILIIPQKRISNHKSWGFLKIIN